MTNQTYSENLFSPIINAGNQAYEYACNKTKEYSYGYLDFNFFYKIIGGFVVGYHEGQEDAWGNFQGFDYYN